MQELSCVAPAFFEIYIVLSLDFYHYTIYDIADGTLERFAVKNAFLADSGKVMDQYIYFEYLAINFPAFPL